MYTLCSHCHTVHEVTPEDLARGRGRLRCQHCDQDFDALEHLSGEPPAAASSLAEPEHVQESLNFDASVPDPVTPTPEPATPSPSASDHANADITADHIKTRPAEDATQTKRIDIVLGPDADPETAGGYEVDAHAQPLLSVTEAVSADEYADATNAADAGPWLDPDSEDPADADLEEDPDTCAEPPAPPPSFIPAATRASPDRAHNRPWRRWLLVAALALVLVAQCIVAEQARLSADARWRPWMERACASLGCTLPTWHDPHAMHVLTRDVRPHPSVSDALLISASFRNEAPWPQHWPKLELTLSNLDGHAIASREFTPSEYLGLGASEQTIQAGQTASITLEVRDPGRQAVAFEFDFR